MSETAGDPMPVLDGLLATAKRLHSEATVMPFGDGGVVLLETDGEYRVLGGSPTLEFTPEVWELYRTRAAEGAVIRGIRQTAPEWNVIVIAGVTGSVTYRLTGEETAIGDLRAELIDMDVRT